MFSTPCVNTGTGLKCPTTTDHNKSFFAAAPFTYLGTQLGDERSTSHVAYRFMWTGRLEVMLTGFEGCMCGEGTPPVRGSPPRSDILEAGAFSRGWWEETPQSSGFSVPVFFFFGCLNFRSPLLHNAYTAPAYKTGKTVPLQLFSVS